MTRPQRRSYACRLAAVICLGLGAYAATHQPGLAAPGAAAAVFLWAIGRDYHRDHRALLARHEQARRAAVLYPDPQRDGPPLTSYEAAQWALIASRADLDQEQP
ncbi:hypothetical protein DF268_08625 [Streptomyces sp. V2]|uniref:hypothetical protein n=1 Tax=Streptomyces sp. V2 TaxID=1424099 RepID=UPI000D66F88B|nr:hypothetical protein [Streptomyces sp. V2]PWG13920.1 hypothetical protein DF268_08625 [Streptomyces sp. V2]